MDYLYQWLKKQKKEVLNREGLPNAILVIVFMLQGEQMKPFTLSTSKMANYLDVSKDFLLKNKEVLFKKGIHYYEPNGLKKTLWNVERMEQWITSKERNPFKDVINEL